MTWIRTHSQTALFVAATALLAVGAAFWVLGASEVAKRWWLAGAALGLLLSVIWTMAAVRRRELTVDVIALLALAGAVATGEEFAGAVVTVMLASGSLLEARAAARARRELSMLADRAPRTARRYEAGALVVVPIDVVARGDQVVVGTGEIVPVDGRLLGPGAFDESALTGEALPVERSVGDQVRSGVVNLARPVRMIATVPAAESTYAGVVRLVEQAQASSAPFVRAADRIAAVFVPLTVLTAGLAWGLSGEAVRAVAVLVVATPCPLLLAAPIAVISGLSRAALVGVIVKGGAALERLAAGRVLLFDKTGTLTEGRPLVADVVTAGGISADDLLRLAAGLDQVSAHVLASPIVTAARQRGLALEVPSEVEETPGYGVHGVVAGRSVRLGKVDWVIPGDKPAWVRQVRRRAVLEGALSVFVAVDDVPAGALLLEDPVRPDAPRMIRALRAAGISRTVLVTGDRADTAETVGRITGVDAVEAERDPAGKIAVLTTERRNGPTIMVGDGINDAPALAAAGVGVALAARGATASSEAADVVLTVDRIDALADAILIARRSRRIAVQSAVGGMGLSLLAMVVAAVGLLPPALGAVLQEVIDVAAMTAALRALLPVKHYQPSMSADELAIGQRLRAEHTSLRPVVEQVRQVADALTHRQRDLNAARDLLSRLENDVVPHERAEQDLLYPAVAKALGGTDPIGALTRSHVEIEQQVAKLRRLLDDVGPHDPEPEDVVELRRLLYGLYAVLRLHNTLEEEGAFSLLPDAAPRATSPAQPMQ